MTHGSEVFARWWNVARQQRVLELHHVLFGIQRCRLMTQAIAGPKWKVPSPEKWHGCSDGCSSLFGTIVRTGSGLWDSMANPRHSHFRFGWPSAPGSHAVMRYPQCVQDLKNVDLPLLTL
jgi:hypothetical protein